MKVKTRIESAAMAGFMSGSTTWRKIRNSLTPSTRADSMRANGRARMKLRMKRVQNPVWNAMWNSTSPVLVL